MVVTGTVVVLTTGINVGSCVGFDVVGASVGILVGIDVVGYSVGMNVGSDVVGIIVGSGVARLNVQHVTFSMQCMASHPPL